MAQVGSVSRCPDAVVENPPLTQYNVIAWAVPPSMYKLPEQVTVISWPIETCVCWGVIVDWLIVGTLQVPTIQ